MNCFRYKLEHDYGLAPNPFWGIMSLAVCKSQIRKNKYLSIGDWVVGLGSVKLGNLNKLIYAMRVEEIVTFDEYWEDPRFECKKPVINGSLVQMYGDNFYHTTDFGVVQEPSAHSLDNMKTSHNHLQRDTSGKNILLSKHFYYFGDHCPQIPSHLEKFCCTSRGYCYRDIDEDFIHEFIKWLERNYEVGIHGDPINWREYKLPEMKIYEDE